MSARNVIELTVETIVNDRRTLWLTRKKVLNDRSFRRYLERQCNFPIQEPICHARHQWTTTSSFKTNSMEFFCSYAWKVSRRWNCLKPEVICARQNPCPRSFGQFCRRFRGSCFEHGHRSVSGNNVWYWSKKRCNQTFIDHRGLKKIQDIKKSHSKM